MNLIVNSPFGKYKKGDVIDNSSEVERILKSENSTNVVKVAGADAPKAKADTTKTQSGG